VNLPSRLTVAGLTAGQRPPVEGLGDREDDQGNGQHSDDENRNGGEAITVRFALGSGLWLFVHLVDPFQSDGFSALRREGGEAFAAGERHGSVYVLRLRDRCCRSADMAALYPHIPWAPAPGGVAAEHRK
jgi:hypothetical protein